MKLLQQLQQDMTEISAEMKHKIASGSYTVQHDGRTTGNPRFDLQVVPAVKYRLLED